MAIDNYTDIFTNTQQKTAPQALFATMEAVKRGQSDKSALRKAANEFESVFLSQMMGAMFTDTGETNPLFGNQEGDEIFQSMIVDEYAKQISKSGGIGIASYIERELLDQQEVSRDVHNRNYQLGMFRMDEDAPSESAAETVEGSQEVKEVKATAPNPLSDADAVLTDIFQGGNPAIRQEL